MVSKKQSIFGLIAGAAAVCGVLAGCGGSSGSGVSNLNPTVAATGGVSTAPGNSTTGASSSPTPQQVQVQSNGGTVTGTLPAGESIPVGGSVNVIPQNQPIINGLTLVTGPGRAQGEVLVDGVDTGLTVTANGSLSGYLFLTPGNHAIEAVGPFAIVNGTQQLTVQDFVFNVVIDQSGVGSIPSALSMKLPANGGSTSNGNFVKVTYPTPNFATGTAQLILSWTGVTKTQTKAISGGVVQFSDPLSDSSDTIPSSGVTSVTFSCTH